VTAAALARVCQVDLKTIHLWAQKDTLPHFRTPGRHLRFYAADVIDFLRRYGYAVPHSLQGDKLQVQLISPSHSLRARWKRGLHKRFLVHSEPHTLSSLLSMGSSPPDAAVIDMDETPNSFEVLEQLAAHEVTQKTRIVACSAGSDDDERMRSLGACAHMAPGNVSALRRALEAALGLGR